MDHQMINESRHFIDSPNPHHGRVVKFDGEDRPYYLQAGQRWLPHAVRDFYHPVKVGSVLTLDLHLARYLGAFLARVVGVRSFRENRTDPEQGIRQVELEGFEGRWFAIGHFEESRQWKLRSGERILILI